MDGRRGLVQLRGGEIESGRSDLANGRRMEPNRSLCAVILEKLSKPKDVFNALQKELRLAANWTRTDPTPWLYSRPVLRQQLFFNDAIDDWKSPLP